MVKLGTDHRNHVASSGYVTEGLVLLSLSAHVYYVRLTVSTVLTNTLLIL